MRLSPLFALSLSLTLAIAGCDDESESTTPEAPEAEAAETTDDEADDADLDAPEEDDLFADLDDEADDDEALADDPLDGILEPSASANDDGEVPDEPEEAAATPSGARHVAHILVRFAGVERAPEDLSRTRAEAEARARQALARAQSGDFGATAEELSDDEASSGHGGDLGSFERGLLPEALESAAFAMDVGEVRGPIETELGYHIVKRLP